MKIVGYKRTKLAVVVASLIGSMNLSADEGYILEEIVVYAQKREQSIMEVPIAVSAYDSESLARAQIRDSSELQQLAPSLSVSKTTGSSDTVFSIRGIGTSGNNAGFEQSVGVFIDGVYRGRSGAALTDYIDLAGIEILKGPQGTLFGRNTAAGVINVRTKAPSYENSSNIEVSAGNSGYKQFKASSTGPLIEDRLAYRLSGSWQEQEGIYDDIVDGEDIGDKDRSSVRAQFLWDINDSASLRIIADYTEIDEVCCTAAPLFYGPSTQLLQVTSGEKFLSATPSTYAGDSGTSPSPFDRDVALNADTKETLRDWGISAELEWDFGETALTVISAYRVSDNENVIDADYSAADLITRKNIVDIEETSVEIRWASTGSNEIDWMVGSYFFDQSIDLKSPISIGVDAYGYFDALSGIAANEILGAAVSPAQIPNLISTLESSLGGNYYSVGDFVNTESDYSAQSFAVFGHGTWNINDKLSLSLGIRYSDEEKDADYEGIQNSQFDALSASDIFTGFSTSSDPVIAALAPAVISPDGTTGAQALTAITQRFQFGAPYDAFESEYEDDNISGAVSVNYIWGEELSSYARFARGYKAGGLSLDRTAGGQSPGNPTADPKAPIFESETLNSFEIGLKASLLDGKLTLNSAVFLQEMDDFQFQEFTGTGFTVQNAAKVEGKGIELDYAFMPNEHWLISGGITFQDIVYDEFETGPTTRAQRVAGLRYQDLSGKSVPFTSKVSHSGSFSYRNSLTDSVEWSAGVSYSYRTEYQTEPSGESILEQDSSVVVNVVTSIEDTGGFWAVDFWGKNVTDEELYMAGLNTPFQEGSYNAYLNSAPTWGVTLRLNM